MSEPQSVIGIDLGTTNSCVALFKSNLGGNAEVLPNDLGESVTESRVAFGANGKIIVGKEAVGKLNYIYDVKRIIGLNWESENVMI